MTKQSVKPKAGKNHAESKTSKRMIESLKHEQDALTLRIGGFPYRKIAEALGMSESGAAKAVYRALDRMRSEIRESADQYIQLQLERLDTMLSGVWSDAAKGRYGAIDRVLRIEERRSRLLGLDAATELIIDWRAKLEDEGVSASAVFEEMVEHMMAEIEKASEDKGPTGSETT